MDSQPSDSLQEDNRVRGLVPAERETVILSNDHDPTVRIWTAQRKYISRLRKNAKVIEIRTGYYGTTEWAEFEIPKDEWNPVSGVKRNARKMTEEQKKAATERLRKAREK